MLDDVEPYLLEALCYHEAFFKLGYAPDDVYFALTGNVTIQVALRTRAKQFLCAVASIERQQTEVASAWQRAVALWNAADDDIKRAVWERSHVFRNKVEFLAALVLNGFSPDSKTW